MKKYALFPGAIIAKDGDRHFISSQQLAELYKVPMKECAVIRLPENPGEAYDTNLPFTDEDLEKMIALYPRSDGKYEQPIPSRPPEHLNSPLKTVEDFERDLMGYLKYKKWGPEILKDQRIFNVAGPLHSGKPPQHFSREEATRVASENVDTFSTWKFCVDKLHEHVNEWVTMERQDVFGEGVCSYLGRHGWPDNVCSAVFDRFKRVDGMLVLRDEDIREIVRTEYVTAPVGDLQTVRENLSNHVSEWLRNFNRDEEQEAEKHLRAFLKEKKWTKNIIDEVVTELKDVVDLTDRSVVYIPISTIATVIFVQSVRENLYKHINEWLKIRKEENL